MMMMVAVAVVTNIFSVRVCAIRKQPRKIPNAISEDDIAYVHRNTKHLFELSRLFSQVIYLMCLCLCVRVHAYI